MTFSARSRFTWRLRTSTLPLGRRTLVMGILNVTPDSFSDGNRFNTPSTALDQGLRMLDEGADLIDLGGESTRPNSTPLNAVEEQGRVLPVLRALLKARPDAIISVDTYHAATAHCVCDSGAEVVNDVSGLLWDPKMAEVLAEHQPGAVLMHTRGAPRMWNTLPPLPHADILPMVVSGLAHSLTLARSAGMQRASIVIDPGFGFGKLGDENFSLLAHLQDLAEFDLPVLAGISRKRFLTAHMDDPTAEQRLGATVAANVAAIFCGAHLLRVHDVAAARAAAAVADTVLDAAKPGDEHPHPSGVRTAQRG